MALKLKGSTSGFVAIDAPSVAGNNTLILPENTGSAHQILANDITAGVTTFTQITVSRNGDLTVPGTISIGGTLTYEDVTSVDSVGIVTARGLSIFGNTTGLQVASGISTFQGVTGTTAAFSGEVDIADKIVHNGDTDTTIRFPAANTISLETAGSERMRIDSSGRMGLGVNSPAHKLHVADATTPELIVEDTTNNVKAVVGADNSVARIGSDTNHAVTFRVNDTEKVRIDTSGQMGLGMTPTRMFEVKDSTGANRIANLRGTGVSGAYLAFLDQNTTDDSKCRVGSAGGNNLVMRGDTVQFGTGAGSEYGRFDSSGRLLIGTTTEGTGSGDNLTISDSGNMGMTLRSTDSNYCNIYFSDAETGTAEYEGYISYNHNTNSLEFATGHTERLRITSAGDVGIGENTPLTALHIKGTDTAYGGVGNSTTASGAKIRVQDTAGRILEIVSPGAAAEAGVGCITNHNLTFFTSNTERARLMSGNLTDPALCIGRTNQTVNSSNFGHALFYDGAVGHFRDVTGANTVFRAGGNQGQTNIFGDGDVTNNNNSYGQASDERLKQDIVDAASQWNDIKALRVRKFRFKDNPSGVLQIGVVAQETETVSAGLVQEDGEGMKSVKYSVLYMKSVKALQEAMARIETLESEVAALKGS